MTTIRLKRSDRLAIHLEFDYDGAHALLKSLQAAAAGGEACVPIQFDRGVTKKKRYLTTKDRIMTITQSEENAIEEHGEKVKLSLERDTLEYAVARFQRCLETREFDPPELCELSVVGSRDTDNDLYCVLMK